MFFFSIIFFLPTKIFFHAAKTRQIRKTLPRLGLPEWKWGKGNAKDDPAQSWSHMESTSTVCVVGFLCGCAIKQQQLQLCLQQWNLLESGGKMSAVRIFCRIYVYDWRRSPNNWRCYIYDSRGMGRDSSTGLNSWWRTSSKRKDAVHIEKSGSLKWSHICGTKNSWLQKYKWRGGHFGKSTAK